MKCRVEVEFKFDPDIHPDDARDAIRAFFQRSCKDRQKPPHIILEKMLIASVVNSKDAHRYRLVVKGHTAGLERRWQRACKDGRSPIWDDIDKFILKNWRVIRWPELANKGCSGLREWSPRAAVALLRTLPETEAARV